METALSSRTYHLKLEIARRAAPAKRTSELPSPRDSEDARRGYRETDYDADGGQGRSLQRAATRLLLAQQRAIEARSGGCIDSMKDKEAAELLRHRIPSAIRARAFRRDGNLRLPARTVSHYFYKEARSTRATRATALRSWETDVVNQFRERNSASAEFAQHSRHAGGSPPLSQRAPDPKISWRLRSCLAVSHGTVPTKPLP